MTLHDPAARAASAHDSHGHIELERTIDSITIGLRHRAELGDLKPLVDSIDHLGLLQPITITPDGLLICGRRRLEAVRRLGWQTVRVWVRAGISDELTRLVAEQDENATHKPLAPMEAARLFREMRTLMREDAARRQQATRFGAPMPAGVGSGSGESPEPVSRQSLESRVQAAKFVTGRDSHQQLERICEMERIAANAVRSLRSFRLMWAELSGWSKHYAPERVAREMSDDDWKLFLDVVAETNAFVEAVNQERRRHP